MGQHVPSMPPPSAKTVPAQRDETFCNSPPANLPSARRFSPMLLNAFNYGFFGDVCGREAAAAERRESSGYAVKEVSGREALNPINKLGKGGDVLATVKRAAVKRQRSEDIMETGGDLYART